MAQSEEFEREIISSLKVNDKGWNIQLFEDQNKLNGCVCHKCKCICCDAAELGCDQHEDEDFYA